MLSGENLTKLWKQIVQQEAECELTERWLAQIKAERGHSSPEALAASYHLQELREELQKLDWDCANFLKSGDWMPE